jgi:hypothetical protein
MSAACAAVIMPPARTDSPSAAAVSVFIACFKIIAEPPVDDRYS